MAMPALSNVLCRLHNRAFISLHGGRERFQVFSRNLASAIEIERIVCLQHRQKHLLTARSRSRFIAATYARNKSEILLSSQPAVNIRAGKPSLLNASKPSGTVFQKRFMNSDTSDNQLLDHLQKRIKAGGPITVSDYVKEVLTNPNSGYYMLKDVFGSEGDFITSPEISQMFGEMIGVWIVNEWMNYCDGQDIQIIELGPGRGTLSDDVLRVCSQFPAINNKVSLHLVEVSPALGQLQAAKLSGKDVTTLDQVADKDEKNPGPYRKCKSKYGHDIYWYQGLNDVPKGLSCFIAHEFLDALPFHKFQKTEKGWSEILIDIEEDPEAKNKLRFVLAPRDTAASIAYLKPILDENEKRDHIEVCPGAALIVQTINNRIKESGGFALLADYGHSGEKTDTMRAFKRHKLHDPLSEPGTADITADVDFKYLQRFANESDVDVYGPITQENFLTNMGIGYRLQALLQKAKQSEWTSLITGYRMLTSKEQMGERFKFLALRDKSKADYTPAGFVNLNLTGDEESSQNDKK